VQVRRVRSIFPVLEPWCGPPRVRRPNHICDRGVLAALKSVKYLRSIVLAALCLASFLAAEQRAGAGAASDADVAADSARGWALEAESKGIVIHSRVREGSAIKEFRGVGVIDAPPGEVLGVLDDSEAYPSFMPYTAECRVLKRERNSVLAYQRLELPLVSDRDYTLRTRNEVWQGDQGRIYRIRWEPGERPRSRA